LRFYIERGDDLHTTFISALKILQDKNDYSDKEAIDEAALAAIKIVEIACTLRS
jgi:hypothetical protein